MKQRIERMNIIIKRTRVISVIICTYNRARMFEETVRSFLDCRTDGIDHELLLLDNNFTDKTREICSLVGSHKR